MASLEMCQLSALGPPQGRYAQLLFCRLSMRDGVREIPRAARAWEADWLAVAGDEGPCVAVVDGSHVLLPGPRLPELYRDLENALDKCIQAR